MNDQSSNPITSILPTKSITLYRQSAVTGRLQVALVAKWCGGIRDYFEHDYGDIWVFWGKGEHAQWLWEEEKMHAIAHEFLAKTTHGFPPNWIGKWEKLGTNIEAGSRAIAEMDLTRAPVEVLQKEYDAAIERHRAMWALGIFIDSFDAGDDKTEIDRIAKGYRCTPDEIEILLSPFHPSYTTVWEHTLYQLQKGERSAADVWSDFFWIRTDYHYFKEVNEQYVTNAARTAKDPSWTSPREKEIAILRTYNLAENPFALFQLLTQWRDDRKRLNFVGLYGIMRIITEIVRRHGTEARYARNLLPVEARALFEHAPDAALRELLRTRFDTETFARIGTDGTYKVLDGAMAREAFAALERTQTTTHERELRGVPARRGITQGPVRIVLNTESGSAKAFQKGDILVAPMTRPEYVPLMKLAAGIVTDEGGITSHAAIVSRELRKPCVVGTKIATQVLKDGDLVEVDAERGVVRIAGQALR